MAWDNLRMEPYDPDARDADGDGIVQERTPWERPAGTVLIDRLGQAIDRGSSLSSRPTGMQVVDRNGKIVPYTPSYEKTEMGGGPTPLSEHGAPSLRELGFQTVASLVAKTSTPEPRPAEAPPEEPETYRILPSPRVKAEHEAIDKINEQLEAAENGIRSRSIPSRESAAETRAVERALADAAYSIDEPRERELLTRIAGSASKWANAVAERFSGTSDILSNFWTTADERELADLHGYLEEMWQMGGASFLAAPLMSLKRRAALTNEQFKRFAMNTRQHLAKKNLKAGEPVGEWKSRLASRLERARKFAENTDDALDSMQDAVHLLEDISPSPAMGASGSPEAIQAKNREILAEIAKTGSTFGDVSNEFAELHGVRTNEAITEDRKAQVRYLVGAWRRQMQGEPGKTLIGSANPALQEFISTHTDEEIIEAIEQAALDFFDIFDKENLRVQIKPSRLVKFLADGRYKTTHEVKSDHSGPDARAEYEMSLGYALETPAHLRPASGYLMGTDERGEFESSDRKLQEAAGDVFPYGEIEITLKPEVAGRTGAAFGDSLNGRKAIVRLDETDPDIIKNAVIDFNGLAASETQPVLFSLLQASIDGDFREVSYRGKWTTGSTMRGGRSTALYVETLIAGGFDVNEIASIRMSDNALKELMYERMGSQKFNERMSDLLSPEQLSAAGFSGAEIAIVQEMIRENGINRIPGYPKFYDALMMQQAKSFLDEMESMGISITVTSREGLNPLDPSTMRGYEPGDSISDIPLRLARRILKSNAEEQLEKKSAPYTALAEHGINPAAMLPPDIRYELARLYNDNPQANPMLGQLVAIPAVKNWIDGLTEYYLTSNPIPPNASPELADFRRREAERQAGHHARRLIEEYSSMVKSHLDEIKNNPENREKMVRRLKSILRDEPVCVNLTDEALIGIAESGRMKTQFETGTSRGVLDPDFRSSIEALNFGAPHDMDPKIRPIYGHIPNEYQSLEEDTTWAYGEIRVVLDSSVKNRATFSTHDSLRDSVVSPLTAPDLYAAYLDRGETPYHGYIETQIFGGVAASDITELVVGPWYKVEGSAAQRVAGRLGIPLIQISKTGERIHHQTPATLPIEDIGDSIPSPSGSPEAIIAKNKEVLDAIRESGSEFGGVDEAFVERVKDIPRPYQRIFDVKTPQEITSQRTRVVKEYFSVFREALRGELPEDAPDWKVALGMKIKLAHPDVQRDILESSDEDLIERLKAIAVDFHRGVARNAYAQIPTDSRLESFLSDGRYKTTHEAASDHSPPDMRAAYEVSLGYDPSAPAHLRPASGYVNHPDWGQESENPFAYLDTDAAGRVGIYGEARIKLKEEVAGRIKFGRGDSLNGELSPAGFDESDPDIILNSLIYARGKEGDRMSTMMLNFLEADRTWSYRHVNSPQGFDPNAESHPGRDYFEALIAGSFSLDDVEEIKIPDYAFGRFALTGTDLEDERKKLLPTDKLRDLGFTEAEIQYLYSLIGTNDFPADAAVHNLIEYRAMKRKKEQIEALGPKVVVTTYKGTDMFSPTTYGAQTSEEIESILEKRIYDTVLKETKRKMAPRRPIDPEDEM